MKERKCFLGLKASEPRAEAEEKARRERVVVGYTGYAKDGGRFLREEEEKGRGGKCNGERKAI